MGEAGSPQGKVAVKGVSLEGKSYAAAANGAKVGGGGDGGPGATELIASSVSCTSKVIGASSDTYLTELDATKWLTHISSMLRGALLVQNLMMVSGQSVLVHCSDGWDRT